MAQTPPPPAATGTPSTTSSTSSPPSRPSAAPRATSRTPTRGSRAPTRRSASWRLSGPSIEVALREARGMANMDDAAMMPGGPRRGRDRGAGGRRQPEREAARLGNTSLTCADYLAKARLCRPRKGFRPSLFETARWPPVTRVAWINRHLSRIGGYQKQLSRGAKTQVGRLAWKLLSHSRKGVRPDVRE